MSRAAQVRRRLGDATDLVPRWLPRQGPALLLATTFVALAWWTWGKWFHAFIDYGRELYVPWRIVEGDVLYRDIAYFNGPLSPYLDAGLFALFGTGIRTLSLANLAIIALATWLIYRIVAGLCDRLTATVAGVVFLVGFAFQYLDQLGGNFNWVAPYSHEASHGLVLALLAVCCVRWHQVGRRRSLALAACGLALGACALTKPEVLIGASAGVAAGLAATWIAERASLRAVALRSMVLVATAVVPVAAAWALLATAMPGDAALRGALGAWAYVFLPQLADLQYYEWVMGTQDVLASLGKAASWLVAHALAVAPMVGLAFLVARPLRPRRLAVRGLPCLAVVPVLAMPLAPALGHDLTLLDPVVHLLLFGGLYSLAVCCWHEPWLRPALAAICGAAMLLAVFGDGLAFTEMFRPLNAYAIAFVAVAAVLFWRDRGRRGLGEDRAWLLCVAGLAAGLLVKIALFGRVHHYGFTLSVPAALLAVGALTYWIPSAIARRGGIAAIPRAGGVGLLAALCVALVGKYDRLLHVPGNAKVVAVGEGGDAFVAREASEAGPLAQLTEWTRATMAPGATLAVIPEGIMLNYLWRRVNPTGHVNLMPPETIMFGEARILDDFRRHAPDYVIVVHRPSVEYGLDLFGTDYAVELYRWVRASYEVVGGSAQEPLQQVDRPGVLVLRRKPAAK